MQLAHKIQNIHWSLEYPKIISLIKKDQNTYRTLSYIFAGLSVLFLFVFQVGLIFTLPLTGGLWYANFKNRKKEPTALLFKIKQKEFWHRPRPANYNNSYDSEYVDDSASLYFFEIENAVAYSISETRHEKKGSTKLPSRLKINKRLFDEFKEGDEAFFIFSPANDLIAYYFEEKIILLIKNNILSNGEVYSTSVSIPQELTYPPNNNGFLLMD